MAIHVGSWKVPVTAVAWGLSTIIHGGLLTASYFVTWRPAPISNPEVSFARGDQASRIEVQLIPWPDSPQEEKTKEETQKDTPPSVTPTVTVNADKVEVVTLPEELTSDSRIDPSVLNAEPRDQPTEQVPKKAVVDHTPVHEEVAENPPLDNNRETVPQAQPVAKILDTLFDRFTRFITELETNDRADHQPPSVDATMDVAVPPMTAESNPSKASSAQTVGVETGVETLHLPTPKYPSLSRKRGEEGLVLLQVEVLPDGSVGEIIVLEDAGFRRLTQAAISAVRKGRFKPATRDGHPTKDTVRIPFRFILR